VGQRKGLQLGYPAPDGKPRYVLEVRPKTNEVIVGPKEALAISELAGSMMSFAGADPVRSGFAEDASDEHGFGCEAFACHVQVRAHADPVPASARVEAGELIVSLHEPLLGVAPGQSAVIYVGTRVLGQCTIDRTVSALQETARV
jgi:tRNA-specific 2-thiouridylase